jgi:hypothetical protein
MQRLVVNEEHHEARELLQLMNSVFLTELDKFIVLFIDDILIYSKIAEEHAGHLRIVLQ